VYAGKPKIEYIMSQELSIYFQATKILIKTDDIGKPEFDMYPT
jgi:hypothetical protein